MYRSIGCASLVAMMAYALVSFAQTPAAEPPAGATGLCKDGSYWTSATKRGACSKHQGVQEWYGKPATAIAPGGGPDKVWVNTPSKVYHCPGDRWYGKTQSGKYMTEAAAKAQGVTPDHGAACK